MPAPAFSSTPSLPHLPVPVLLGLLVVCFFLPGASALTALTDENFKTVAYRWLVAPNYGLETYGHISAWNVSAVTDMSYMFSQASSFNGDLSAWDVSAVTTMYRMFYYASSFSQRLCWDVTGKNTGRMFSGTAGGSVGGTCAPTPSPSPSPTPSPSPSPSYAPTGNADSGPSAPCVTDADCAASEECLCYPSTATATAEEEAEPQARQRLLRHGATSSAPAKQAPSAQKEPTKAKAKTSKATSGSSRSLLFGTVKPEECYCAPAPEYSAGGSGRL